jgi:hypothetical protein
MPLASSHAIYVETFINFVPFLFRLLGNSFVNFERIPKRG